MSIISCTKPVSVLSIIDSTDFCNCYVREVRAKVTGYQGWQYTLWYGTLEFKANDTVRFKKYTSVRYVGTVRLTLQDTST